jgi:hypothetical protein
MMQTSVSKGQKWITMPRKNKNAKERRNTRACGLAHGRLLRVFAVSSFRGNAITTQRTAIGVESRSRQSRPAVQNTMGVCSPANSDAKRGRESRRPVRQRSATKKAGDIGLQTATRRKAEFRPPAIWEIHSRQEEVARFLAGKRQNAIEAPYVNGIALVRYCAPADAQPIGAATVRLYCGGAHPFGESAGVL